MLDAETGKSCLPPEREAIVAPHIQELADVAELVSANSVPHILPGGENDCARLEAEHLSPFLRASTHSFSSTYTLAGTY